MTQQTSLWRRSCLYRLPGRWRVPGAEPVAQTWRPAPPRTAPGWGRARGRTSDQTVKMSMWSSTKQQLKMASRSSDFCSWTRWKLINPGGKLCEEVHERRTRGHFLHNIYQDIRKILLRVWFESIITSQIYHSRCQSAHNGTEISKLGMLMIND